MGLPSFLVFLFLIALIGRLIFEWIQAFARDWRPRGPVLVVAESVFTVTDPPLKVLRRVIPPLRLGAVQLDLSFMLLFAVVFILWQALPK
ncbi:MAG: YggT family protein [Kineosporiaceae bacterium]|nr:YggT family protein [Kineosporiaceae bacterium]